MVQALILSRIINKFMGGLHLEAASLDLAAGVDVLLGSWADFVCSLGASLLGWGCVCIGWCSGLFS